MGRYLGVGEEATYATATGSDHFYEALSESLRKEIEFETLETVRGYSPVDLAELTSAIRGDWEMLANYDEIGLLYKHLIGSVDTTTDSPSAGFNTHTFPANSGIPSADRIGLGLTVEIKRDDQLFWKYAGCKIASFSHEQSISGAGRITVGVTGSSETTATSGTSESFPTFLPVLPKQCTVSFDGGSTTFSARSFSVEVANAVDEPYILGQTTFGPEPQRSEIMRVTGQVEALFTDFDEYNSFDGSTVVDIQLAMVNGTYSITYNMNKCRLIQATPAVSGRDRLTATYEFESYYDATATENLQVVLVNGDTSP